MKHFGYLLLILLFFNQCRNKEENIITQFPGKPEVPASLKEVHKHAKSEEDVFFPAAILVGDFIKLKSARTGQ